MPGKEPAFVRRLFSTEFFRYFIAGTIAFIVDFSVLVFCTEVLGVHYLYSNVAGYAIGLIVSYTINITWVFDHRRFNNRQNREFAYFTFIALIGLGTSELVIWLVTEYVELPYTWSKVISAFFVVLFNFAAKKWFLFSPARD